jgi:hypothetical protein
MEYLMTYGWAILIIAVVLGALFQLGIFSGNAFVARAPAGSCQIERTSAGVSLEGECQGILPQYTASATSTSSVVANVPSSYGGYPSAVTMWVYQSDSDTEYDVFSSTPYTTNPSYPLEAYTISLNVAGTDSYQAGGLEFTDTCACYSTNYYYQADGVTLSNNAWHFIALTFNSLGDPELFVDGTMYPTTLHTGSGPAIPAGMSTGVMDTSFGGVNGIIANVQIYNYSLSEGEIDGLYLEGIGGAPTRPQSLVGWWPLNGNAQDYSGNNDNGAASGVSYVGDWVNAYMVPRGT